MITLYGLDKGGKYKIWQCFTVGAEIHVIHGQEGGKLQEKITVAKGKNIGRSNETSPEQQAISEAQSKINKQKDKGYREDKAELEELPLLPMLAHDYLKQGHRISYPCYTSVKLDGVRCLAIRSEDEVELRSRGGKRYNIPHVELELLKTMEPGEVWDGELYIHGKYLEEIVSAVKKPNDLTPLLKFVIFDVLSDETFEDRLAEMDVMSMELERFASLEVLEYQLAENDAHMKQLHKIAVANGFEGIMLRNLLGLYEIGKRSADLQKYKEFLHEEFTIKRVIEDKNGNAVFEVYDIIANLDFTVTLGDFDFRQYALANPVEFIGKDLTVKFQTRYKDSKLPQFPTGVVIRDYE